MSVFLPVNFHAILNISNLMGEKHLKEKSLSYIFRGPFRGLMSGVGGSGAIKTTFL